VVLALLCLGYVVLCILGAIYSKTGFVAKEPMIVVLVKLTIAACY
jgi:hypothetical protein